MITRIKKTESPVIHDIPVYLQWEVSRLGHRDLVLCAGHFECDAAYGVHRLIDQFYGQRTE